MKKVCFVTTSPLIVNFFLVPHLLSLRSHYQVTLVVNTAEGMALKPLPGVEIVSLALQRKISPLRDLRALSALITLFKQRRFDIVHSMSPKAGLLAMVAARIVGVPHRVHTFTGQVWATRRGLMRTLLRAADRLIACAATQLLTDSFSQRAFLVEQGIASPSSCSVLGSGSVSGVDVERFRPDAERRNAVRRELGIPHDAMTILFLGRMTRDKGIPELLDAFLTLADAFPLMHLLLVGPDEEALIDSVRIHSHARRIRVVGYTDQPERYIAAADVLCLPSHREGFGSVIIEAAASGVPAVASRIYGITDAVVEEETGLLHRPGDAQDLRRQLSRLIGDEVLRRRLGNNARDRAVEKFSQLRLTTALSDFYARLLGS